MITTTRTTNESSVCFGRMLLLNIKCHNIVRSVIHSAVYAAAPDTMIRILMIDDPATHHNTTRHIHKIENTLLNLYELTANKQKNDPMRT